MWWVICNDAKISSRDLGSDDLLPRKLKKASVLSKWLVTCMFSTKFSFSLVGNVSQTFVGKMRDQCQKTSRLRWLTSHSNFYLSKIFVLFHCCNQAIHTLTNGDRFAKKSCSFTWNHVQNWTQVKSAILFGTFRPCSPYSSFFSPSRSVHLIFSIISWANSHWRKLWKMMLFFNSCGNHLLETDI